MGKLLRFLKKNPRVWVMVIKAFFLSAVYRWQILKRPFAELSKKIGEQNVESTSEPQDEKYIRDVQYAVKGICRRTPWESKCLVQALTAKKLLNQHGLPCTLYMGVSKDDKGEMIAHAWLRCGNIFVTGGIGHLYYAVTGVFGDK